MTYPKPLFAYPNGKKVMAGFMQRPGVFRKHVSREDHLYHEMVAWGIDKELFLSRLEPEVHLIEIWDKDEHIMYRISVEKFENRAIEREFGKHGVQYFCPLIYFSTEKDGVITLPKDEQLLKDQEENQLSFPC